MPFWSSASDQPCKECDVIKTQLAELLEEINYLQSDLDTVRQERDIYQQSCISSRLDLRNGNTIFLQNKQQINELVEKVRLYQEANQVLFEKCASVNDLEGEIRTLRERINELEEINWRGSGAQRPVSEIREAEIQTEQPYEPHAGLYHAPSRALALTQLSKHLQELPDHLKPINMSNMTMTITSLHPVEH